MTESSSKELVHRLEAGSSAAATRIHDRYVRRLIALARSRLSPRLAARLDPDDVVQSAYRSFFMHARDGAYVFERAGDLWCLLAQITLHKLHGQIEHQTAQRRNPDREVSQDEHLHPFMSAEPTSEAVVAAIDQLRVIMQRLNETERRILSQRLQGKSIPEIATDIQRSQRTVRRILQELEELMVREFRRDT